MAFKANTFLSEISCTDYSDGLSLNFRALRCWLHQKGITMGKLAKMLKMPRRKAYEASRAKVEVIDDTEEEVVTDEPTFSDSPEQESDEKTEQFLVPAPTAVPADAVLAFYRRGQCSLRRVRRRGQRLQPL